MTQESARTAETERARQHQMMFAQVSAYGDMLEWLRGKAKALDDGWHLVIPERVPRMQGEKDAYQSVLSYLNGYLSKSTPAETPDSEGAINSV